MVLIGQISAPEMGLIYTDSNVQLKVGPNVVGKGTLWISQNALSWQPNNMPNGLAIDWRQISVHGVSTIPNKCIYFMLDCKLDYGNPAPNVAAAANGQLNGNQDAEMRVDDGIVDDDNEDEGNATDEEEEAMTECWLIPDNENAINTMFQAMTDCQALHPDSADSFSDDSDYVLAEDGNEMDAAEDDQQHANDPPEGSMQNLNINDERFDDADN